MTKLITDPLIKKQIASGVLRDLPDWFGIPEYTNDYIETSQNLDFIAVYKEQIPIGFIVLKPTSDVTCEIYCMGILKKYHRQGFGKKLYEAFEVFAKQKNFKFIQVKTVQFGKYEQYDRTNSFYEHLGFQKFELIPDLWDEWNPCQIWIKSI